MRSFSAPRWSRFQCERFNALVSLPRWLTLWRRHGRSVSDARRPRLPDGDDPFDAYRKRRHSPRPDGDGWDGRSPLETRASALQRLPSENVVRAAGRPTLGSATGAGTVFAAWWLHLPRRRSLRTAGRKRLDRSQRLHGRGGRRHPLALRPFEPFGRRMAATIAPTPIRRVAAAVAVFAGKTLRKQLTRRRKRHANDDRGVPYRHQRRRNDDGRFAALAFEPPEHKRSVYFRIRAAPTIAS